MKTCLKTRLRAAVVDEKGRSVQAGGLAHWLLHSAPARARGEVTIVLVGDKRMRSLNRRFRRLDRATDVLSFPAEEHPPSRSVGVRNPSLGDIVIATGMARRHAQHAGHSFSTELRVLALHGLLHLLGYDHERDRGTMARIEQRLRRRGGLREGLIER